MNFQNDIPESIARAAHYGTSMVPERRGEQEREGYASTMQSDYDHFREQAEKGNTLEFLESEFAQYRSGYAERFRAYLVSRSRCMSAMITGPSNFPTRRNEKRNRIADKRSEDLSEYRKRAHRAIMRVLRPDLRPIMSGDSDAVQRLKAELGKLEALQAQMKAINVAHKAFLKNPHSLETVDLPESIKQTVRQYVPQYSWEPHPIAPFQLTNNGANIRRVKQRIEQLSQAKALPNAETENKETGITVEDCPAENRVRIFFPCKPSEEVRSKLKANGFRWAPSIGAWQAYRNYRSQQVAQEMTA